MSIIELEIKNTKLQFNMEFNRRINFIKGNSATGKTTFYSLLDRFLNIGNMDVELKSTLPVYLVTLGNIDLLNQSSNAILIIDDLDLINNERFLKLYHKQVTNNFWFLIMSREEVSDDYKTTLTFSTQSLYKLVSSDNKYWLEPLFSFDTSSTNVYDYIIIEDENGGFEFFSKLFNTSTKIQSSHGEGNIIKCTEKAIKQGYSDILVIFDNASFGCRFEEFYKKFAGCSVNISIISQYECFEELLSRTTLLHDNPIIQDSLSNIEVEANQYKSWEKYFEYLVNKATGGKPYFYSHGSSLRDCYLVNCSQSKHCNEHIKLKCDYKLKSCDKIDGLLRDTEYDFLLAKKVK